MKNYIFLTALAALTTLSPSQAAVHGRLAARELSISHDTLYLTAQEKQANCIEGGNFQDCNPTDTATVPTLRVEQGEYLLPELSPNQPTSQKPYNERRPSRIINGVVRRSLLSQSASDSALLPQEKAKNPVRHETESFKRLQRVSGAPHPLKDGEWYAVGREKDTKVKDKNGETVLTCHKALVVGHVTVKHESNSETWDFTGKMFELVLERNQPKGGVKAMNLERDLPHQEDENIYRFTPYKGVVKAHWRDFGKIKELGAEHVRKHPQWSWEEANCHDYVDAVWAAMQK